MLIVSPKVAKESRATVSVATIFACVTMAKFAHVNDPLGGPVSISLTSLCNAQTRQHKVNGTKDAVLFHQHFCLNVTVYLGESSCAEHRILAHFCQNAGAIKASKIVCAKATLL